MSFQGQTIHIVGAGLAGSECAFQLAELGHNVVLYEMRSVTMTPAHKTGKFAELVCSNSFGSTTEYSAPGQLKWEAEQMGSLNLRCARMAAVPAGMALGVDRELFADEVTKAIANHPRIQVNQKLVQNLDEVPRPAVIATGPLTHDGLANDLLKHFKDPDQSEDFLYFYDAIAPVIDVDTIDMDIVYRANRWNKGNADSRPDDGDYLNCPMDKDQYFSFIDAITEARKVELKEFEKTPYFESCMPIEVMVERGRMTPRFGPMSAKGLPNPRAERDPFAVVQLRQDNKEGTAYNMVGFQTKMAYGEQKRVFRMIPGLENAEFLKLGSIHRNLYIHSPSRLSKQLSSRKDPLLFFAGQITGVEGYFESTCVGLMIARFIHDFLSDKTFNPPPRASAMGSLLNAITEETKNFQPTNINFGLLPRPEGFTGKGRKSREGKRDMQVAAAKVAFKSWL